jgi:hypothetical protein
VDSFPDFDWINSKKHRIFRIIARRGTGGAAANQQIVLTGVDLTGIDLTDDGTLSDQDILNNRLSSGSLIVDQ